MNRALRSFHVLFCATALVAVAAAPLACEAGSRDAFTADAAPPGTDSAMTRLAPPDTTPDARALAFVGDTTLGYDGVTISTALVMARRDLEVETQRGRRELLEPSRFMCAAKPGPSSYR